MKDLLKYIVKEITGNSDFEIEENHEDNQMRFDLKLSPDVIGLVIGKNGNTIKSIRNLLKVRAVLEKKSVFLSVSEKTES